MACTLKGTVIDLSSDLQFHGLMHFLKWLLEVDLANFVSTLLYLLEERCCVLLLFCFACEKNYPRVSSLLP